MVIHLYTFIHNEEKILPFFFKHYEKFVNKFFVYDNGSTDGTLEFLKERDDVVIKKFNTKNKQNNLVLTKLKNTVWKNSVGKCDLVIVCDADEFLYHRNMKKFLAEFLHEKYSVGKPFGHEMLSEDFPEEDQVDITKQIKSGIFAPMMSKCVIFDPKRIVRINYQHGAHNCFPEGLVKLYRKPQLKLLHYKQLSLEYFMERIRKARKRVPKKLVKMGLSTHYFKDDKIIKKNFTIGLKNSKQVI